MASCRVWPALVVFTGCSQVFGLDDPRLGSGLLVQQGTGGQDGGSSVTVSLPQPPIAGDLLVAAISTDTHINEVQAISGASDAWTEIVHVAGTGGSCSGCIRGAMWYAFASNADTSIRVDVSPGDDFVVSISEWSKIASFDASATAGPDTTVNVSSGRVDTSAGELVIAMGAWDQQDVTAGPTGGFTALAPASSTGGSQLASASLEAGGGQVETSWTLAQTTQSWVGVIATFARN